LRIDSCLPKNHALVFEGDETNMRIEQYASQSLILKFIPHKGHPVNEQGLATYPADQTAKYSNWPRFLGNKNTDFGGECNGQVRLPVDEEGVMEMTQQWVIDNFNSLCWLCADYSNQKLFQWERDLVNKLLVECQKYLYEMQGWTIAQHAYAGMPGYQQRDMPASIDTLSLPVYQSLWHTLSEYAGTGRKLWKPAPNTAILA